MVIFSTALRHHVVSDCQDTPYFEHRPNHVWFQKQREIMSDWLWDHKLKAIACVVDHDLERS